MTTRVLILVEGQTEERFVKDLLAPELLKHDMFIAPTLLVTKKVKDGPNYKGGVTTFARFENDARRVLDNNGGAVVTTMLDYYGLPSDFPGMATRPPHGTSQDKALHVELCIEQYFGRPRFIPFLVLHEFEGLLFTDVGKLCEVMSSPNSRKRLEKIRGQFSTPEDINDSPYTAPSKRLADEFPAFRKVLHGTATAQRIGLDSICAECPHFCQWLARVKSCAT